MTAGVPEASTRSGRRPRVLVLGANASCQLLKTRLPRPDLSDFPGPNSFPSGHAAAAASVAFALILVLPFAIRGTVALIGAAYVTVIAIATVWAEWHRPSDTVAALLVVLAWSAGASTLVRARRARIPGVTARPNRLAMLLFGGVGALCAVAGLLGIGAVVLSERVLPDLVSGRFAFFAGAAAITAAVAGVFAIWVRLAAGDRVVATANMGDDPTLMLNAPVPATRRVLARAGLSLEDIDLFEINEAFAVVTEKYIRDLKVDRDKVNVNGGSMALGHPIGATGSMLIGTVLDELERRGLRRGLVTMCASGGMAPAIIIERV